MSDTNEMEGDEDVYDPIVGVEQVTDAALDDLKNMFDIKDRKEDGMDFVILFIGAKIDNTIDGYGVYGDSLQRLEENIRSSTRELCERLPNFELAAARAGWYRLGDNKQAAVVALFERYVHSMNE